MKNADDIEKKQKPKFSILRVLIGVMIVPIVLVALSFLIEHPSHRPLRIICGSYIKSLGNAIVIYANDSNSNTYPSPDNWCDLLVKNSELDEKTFICPGSKQGRCHYAINPNCEPNSPGDMVLLFETKAGWNQHGGPELLTTENHKGKGSNVLFNNGTVKFINKDQINTLKWK